MKGEPVQNLTALLNLLLGLAPYIPEAEALVERVLEMIRQKEPTKTNAELIADLAAHGTSNMAFVDAWLAAHPT